MTPPGSHAPLTDAERSYLRRAIGAHRRIWRTLGAVLVLLSATMLVIAGERLWHEAFIEAVYFGGWGVGTGIIARAIFHFLDTPLPEDLTYNVGMLTGPYRWLNVTDRTTHMPVYSIGGTRIRFPHHWTRYLKDGERLRARVATPDGPNSPDDLYVLSLEKGLNVEAEMEAGLARTSAMHPGRMMVAGAGSIAALIAVPIVLLDPSLPWVVTTATLGLPCLAVTVWHLGHYWRFLHSVREHYRSHCGLEPMPRSDRTDEQVTLSSDEVVTLLRRDSTGGVDYHG